MILQERMMLQEYKIKFSYTVNGDKYNSESLSNEHYEFNVKASSKDRLTLSIIPKASISDMKLSFIYKYNFAEDAKVYPNGYQSWTYAKEYTVKDKLEGLKPLAKLGWKLTSIFGDYPFKKYPTKSGIFHGFTYSYIRVDEDVTLLGSLSETQGYTIFNFDMNDGIIDIEKELEGLTISSEYDLFDIVCLKGGYDKVFNEYFKIMNVPKPKVKHMSGYTSWYNYFGKITEDILMRDLNGMDKVKGYSEIFQIDDGFQIKVGDWLTLKDDKFPNGMKYLADAIHNKGLLAGLWLAPFSCARSSQVAKDHPDWLVKDDKGKPVLGSIAWGGAYIIDFYNKEAAQYIKNFFNEVLNVWGFNLVKLDFLYSICLTPRYNKTRGTIMCEAMDFLRECVGDKLILGCGVPLGPSFGKVDLCRISCDVDLSYKNKIYYWAGNREIVNTRSAMNNTIFRRHLDGKVFCNDPDVFFLRNNNLSFTHEQKLLLAKVNNMFGNVLFVSDNIGDYDDNQLSEAKKSFTQCKAKIISADYLDAKNLRIIYEEQKQKYQWDINIMSGKNSLVAI